MSLQGLHQLQNDPVRVPEVDSPAFAEAVGGEVKFLRRREKLHPQSGQPLIFALDIVGDKAELRTRGTEQLRPLLFRVVAGELDELHRGGCSRLCLC